MTPQAITKIVFLVLITILAIISVMAGFVMNGRKRKEKKDIMVARRIMKIRLICFVAMLVCLLICVVI